MSSYIYEYLEVRESGSWRIISNPMKLDKDDENLFNISYTSLRDELFGGMPYKSEDFIHKGVPKDFSGNKDKVLEKRNVIHFTVAEIIRMAETLEHDADEALKREAIDGYICKIAYRLGYAKHMDNDFEETAMAESTIKDLRTLVRIAYAFGETFSNICSELSGDWTDAEDIRITAWCE